MDCPRELKSDLSARRAPALVACVVVGILIVGCKPHIHECMGVCVCARMCVCVCVYACDQVQALHVHRLPRLHIVDGAHPGLSAVPECTGGAGPVERCVRSHQPRRQRRQRVHAVLPLLPSCTHVGTWAALGSGVVWRWCDRVLVLLCSCHTLCGRYASCPVLACCVKCFHPPLLPCIEHFARHVVCSIHPPPR
jgi:hypothetical protein